MTLSPEARGTLAALKELSRLRSFTPDCAEVLVAAGLARLERDNELVLTKKGAGVPVYAEVVPANGSGDSHA